MSNTKFIVQTSKAAISERSRDVVAIYRHSGPKNVGTTSRAAFVTSRSWWSSVVCRDQSQMTAQQAIDLAFDVAIRAMATLMDAGMSEIQARETLRMALDVSEEIGANQ